MSSWVDEGEVKSRMGHKVLLAGLSEAGKTAVKKMYFNNTKVEELAGLQATLNYERLATTINDVPITILDLGGQRVFIKRFLSGFSPFVFSSVKGLIFLIDVSAKTTRNNSLQYFLECLSKLKQFSPKSDIFVFLHKTDLIKKAPNFNTILQLIMEQFQVETDIKIRFFHTTIYDSDTIINSFLRVFEIILPNNTKDFVEDVEHFATVKFTTKNIDMVKKPQLSLANEKIPEMFSKSDLDGASNQMKIAGDLNVLTDIQSLMRDSSIDSKSSVEDDFGIEDQKPFQILSNLQQLIKKGIENKIKDPSKDNIYLLSILSETENFLANPDDIDINKKEYLAKKVMSTLVTGSKDKIAPKDVEIVETFSPEKEKTVDTLYTEIELEKKIQRIMNFYGIKKDDAINIIKSDYEDLVYELVAKSNIPVPVIMNVLLVNVPYLELDYDTSILSNERILEIFANFVKGKIRERELYAILEASVQYSEKTLDEIIGNK